MKRFVLLISAALILSVSAAAVEDSLNVVFWNLENFFDWKDGGTGPSDTEFSAVGSRHWTGKRFKIKCNAIAKTLMWEADNNGSMPDIFGMAEVENEFVVRSLALYTPLSKYGYRYVHYDSPDPRGIDVALLYRPDRVTLVSSDTLRIAGIATRDILLCRFITSEGTPLMVLVNHHPSKYGGKSSESKRLVVMERMLSATKAAPKGCTVLAMGDFNDTLDSEAFSLVDGLMENAALPLYRKGEGTIRFAGKWELIDMFLVSLGTEYSPMRILQPPFLLVRDSAHSGLKPYRTWSGSRWNGGVSDHLPVALTLNIK